MNFGDGHWTGEVVVRRKRKRFDPDACCPVCGVDPRAACIFEDGDPRSVHMERMQLARDEGVRV